MTSENKGAASAALGTPAHETKLVEGSLPAEERPFNAVPEGVIDSAEMKNGFGLREDCATAPKPKTEGNR